MSEMSLPFSGERNRNIDSSWPLQVVGFDALRESGFTGHGITIAVVDPDVDRERDRISEAGYTHDTDIHGFGIAGLIKYMLPEAHVELLPAKTASENLHSMRAVLDMNADIVHLSMAFPIPNVDSPADYRKRNMSDKPVVRRQLHNIDEFVREREAQHWEDFARSIASPAIDSLVNNWFSRVGITIVAASGYSGDQAAGTYARFPDALIVGAFDDRYRPTGTPPDGRVDIWAPGKDVPYPTGRGLKKTLGAYHSFAAPLATVAAAVAVHRVGRDPLVVKQAVLEAADRTQGVPVVDYRLLVAE